MTTLRLQLALAQLESGVVHKDIALQELKAALEEREAECVVLVRDLAREVRSYGCCRCEGCGNCRACVVLEKVERMELGR